MKRFSTIQIVKTKGQSNIFQRVKFIQYKRFVFHNVLLFGVKIGFSFRDSESVKLIFLTIAKSWQLYISAPN